jgi:hypothetical protein
MPDLYVYKILYLNSRKNIKVFLYNFEYGLLLI